MKPYGMTHREHADAHDDVAGATSTAPATRVQGRLKANTYRSLRRGKKDRVRRQQKRNARREALRELNAHDD